MINKRGKHSQYISSVHLPTWCTETLYNFKTPLLLCTNMMPLYKNTFLKKKKKDKGMGGILAKVQLLNFSISLNLINTYTIQKWQKYKY